MILREPASHQAAPLTPSNSHLYPGLVLELLGLGDEKQNPHQDVRLRVAPQLPWGLPDPHVVIRWKLLSTCQAPCSRLGLMGCTCQCRHPSLSRGSRRRQVVPPKEASSEARTEL